MDWILSRHSYLLHVQDFFFLENLPVQDGTYKSVFQRMVLINLKFTRFNYYFK